MTADPGALPQIIATSVGIAVASGIAFFGYTKKWLDKLPKPPNTTSRDAVVISGAFADAAPINKLNASVDTLIHELREKNIQGAETNRLLARLLDESEAGQNLHRSQTQATDSMANSIRILVDVIHASSRR